MEKTLFAVRLTGPKIIQFFLFDTFHEAKNFANEFAVALHVHCYQQNFSFVDWITVARSLLLSTGSKIAMIHNHEGQLSDDRFETIRIRPRS